MCNFDVSLIVAVEVILIMRIVHNSGNYKIMFILENICR